VAHLEVDDIQGIVFSGYPKNHSAVYVLLEVTERRQAGAWLQSVAARLATGEHHAGATTNFALSARGLSALGLPKAALATFSLDFCQGMSGASHRSRILGDTDDSDPSSWEWGAGRPVDAMLMVFAPDAASLDRALAAHRAEYAGAFREVYVRDTVVLAHRHEHFGFADGIAQPTVAGTRRHTPGTPAAPPGEFVLGYVNAYEQLPVSPTVPSSLVVDGASLPGHGATRDLGRNGTYLVVRQLEQRVEEFWDAMAEYSRGPSGEVDQAAAVRLAAKCVGRWPGGAPLVKSPDRDDPKLGRSNDFAYASEDPRGLSCPVGAHIRRTNPRDSLEGGPAESLAVVNRHRIIRRGRSYGPVLAPFARDPQKNARGLFFMCVNANIRRQFEFIQQTWSNNAKFAGLYDDKDPLTGDQPSDTGGSFTIPEVPVRRRLQGLSRFVRVRGGEYFFLPGIRALRFLGALAAAGASRGIAAAPQAVGS
jgi:Dyp-type peroxidase family